MFFIKILAKQKVINSTNITQQLINKINLLLLAARSKKSIKITKIFLNLLNNWSFPLKITNSKLQQNLNQESQKQKFLISHQSFLKNRKEIAQEIIQYIFHINSTYTNTFVNVSDAKGNVKISFSAGSFDLKKKQKTKQPLAILTILKQLFSHFKNSVIAIHFKNIAVNHERFVIKLLKQKFFIKTMRSFNLHPHNGCRPKKLKRLKNRSYKFF
jgi:ribosomal protein S11